MWRLFSFNNNKQTQNDQNNDKPISLPASWYRSSQMYQLERRAIFSRHWILLTHRIRFQKTGDYQSFDIADFPIFLIRDQEGRINGFHNACRHRAFPIVQQNSSGTTSILSCKYHGWSYGLKGNLAKAPRFETVSTFDKTQHSLYSVHVHIDKAGFIWVNLQAGEDAETKWEEQYKSAVDDNPRLQMFDFDDEFTFDHAWDMTVNANWKTLIDNYNECYHCPTSHPLIARVTDLNQYRVEPNEKCDACLEHTIINKVEEKEGQFRRSITYFFPTTSVTITDNFFYIQRMIPLSPTKSIIENEVYRHKNASDEEFDNITAFYRQVLEEDKQLCDGTQVNLNAGVYTSGELHPDKEKGPIHFQRTLRDIVIQHRQIEEQEKKEIWPATPKLTTNETVTKKLTEEEEFCASLNSGICGNRELEW